eukprot:4522003-Pyramimonas_sp.AAC.1
MAVASAKTHRASRELGLPTSILEAQEQEDSVLMTMIIVARTPEVRLARQRAFVERAQRRSDRAE